MPSKNAPRPVDLTTQIKAIVAIILLIITGSFIGFFLVSIISLHTPAVQNLDSAFNVTQLSISSVGSTSNYWAYVASTYSQQTEGYMNQSSLGDCHGKNPCIGMVFTSTSYNSMCFWMKNTLIPLKQVWVAPNGTITAIYNATPLSTSVVCHMGSMVLETSPSQDINSSDVIQLT